MYKIKVNASNVFSLSKSHIEAFDAVETSENEFHVIQQDKSIDAAIIDADFNSKTYTVKVGSNTYEVVINDALDQQIAALGFEIGASKKVNHIKAPMPGLILEINVNAGTEVKENDPLLILEAMKMENIINSPREGIIKNISVEQGETVDKNALLIEFE